MTEKQIISNIPQGNIVDQRDIDILEDGIMFMYPEVLKILLQDKTTGKNILWATNDYASNGELFGEHCEIHLECITGLFATAIQPRAAKPKDVQMMRIKKKAEVFTPCWICNLQNNQIDNAWFGRENVFNIPSDTSWNSTTEPILFPQEKSWEKYVDTRRLEITCGEAPYLVSRYDASSGKQIPVMQRIGLLDRKLRVVSENCQSEAEWYKWALRAFQSVYGYEFQGDSVLVARENLLYTFIDFYKDKFGERPSLDKLKKVANVISWNIWQMNGLSCTVPYSCHDERSGQTERDLFGENTATARKCPGCEKGSLSLHNGIYCKIKDWRDKSTLLFVTMVQKKGDKQ